MPRGTTWTGGIPGQGVPDLVPLLRQVCTGLYPQSVVGWPHVWAHTGFYVLPGNSVTISFVLALCPVNIEHPVSHLPFAQLSGRGNNTSS